MGVEIKLDLVTLDRSSSGAIWGNVWLESNGSHFPEHGWNDLVVAVLLAMARATRSLIEDPSRSAHVPFFDGPLSLELRAGADEFMSIEMHGGKVAEPRAVLVRRTTWVESVATSARQLLGECDRRSWSTRAEVGELRAELARLVQLA